MSRARWIRARAVLLLAVFLTAGSSLPSLDGLLYHSASGAIARSQAHIEPAGGCLNHAEHCTLGRTAPGSGAVGVVANLPRVASDGASAPLPLVSQAWSDTYRFSVVQPRAPPLLRFV
jgi:hypothetical protein